MNGFTSGLDPMRVAPNHDPEPWVARRSPLRRATIRMGERHEWELRPRPEFDVLDNPILAAFRSAIADDDPYADADSWLANLSDMSAESEVWAHDSAHIEHARRVLSKLAALA